MPKDYNISKTSERCRLCGANLQPGQQLVATVQENDDQFERMDYCPDCWEKRQSERGEEGVFGVWRTRVPNPEEKKKLFVDDDLLINFFERLEGAEEPAKVNFRFVLALILMRKKLLIYDKSVKGEDGNETWRMHFKGSQQRCEVIDPHMDEEKIAQVSGSLGDILEGQL